MKKEKTVHETSHGRTSWKRKRREDTGNSSQGGGNQKIPTETATCDENNDQASSSSEDDDLMAAAAAWAEQTEARSSSSALPVLGKNKPQRQKTKNEQKSLPNQPELIAASRAPLQVAATATSLTPTAFSAPTNSFSLHVTQLAFTATQFDIRHHFVSQGCAVTSVRLVYDHGGGNNNSNNNNKMFRGVAFVDVQGQDSYDICLEKLHKSTLLGRRINVRPTKTKQELGSIVERTKELVVQKIKQAKDQVAAARQKEEEKGNKEAPSGKHAKDTLTRKSSSSKGAKLSTNAKKQAGNTTARKQTKTKAAPLKKKSKTKAAPPTKTKDPDRKLTKKERNRRAAIILQKKRRG